MTKSVKISKRGILLETLNLEFSKSRNPFWYNRPVRAQTHVKPDC